MDRSRYINIATINVLTGKDRNTITKRLEEVKPYKEDGRSKWYDAHEVLPLIYAQDNLKGMQKKMEQLAYDIDREKLNKIKIDNDTKMGRLVEINEVCKTVEKEYTFVKTQMKGLPSRVSKLIAMETDPAIINKVLTDAINEILTELVSDERYYEHMETLEKLENEVFNEATTSPDSESQEDTDTASGT